jgi:hypothetical protein
MQKLYNKTIYNCAGKSYDEEDKYDNHHSLEDMDILRETYPSRNTFKFDNGIQITSDFDSGNLLKCV